MNTPKWDWKRGRHKKHASSETEFWNRNHLIPECPPWMDMGTYHELVRLRNEAQGLASTADDQSGEDSPAWIIET